MGPKENKENAEEREKKNEKEKENKEEEKGIVLGASGAGLVNSFLWRQILSDISGLPLFVYGEEEEERGGGGVVQYEKKDKKNKKEKKGKKKDQGEATSLGTALLMQRDTHWKFAALGKIGKEENEERERDEGMDGNKER